MMPRRSRSRQLWAPIALAALMLVGSAARAQDADRVERVREAMLRFVEDGKIAGAVTLVGGVEGTPEIQAVGRADIVHGLPMSADTIFRVASMTKPITALAIMMLVDEGKLKVDDRVDKYLPEFVGQKLVAGKDGDRAILKDPSRPITVRDLLTHTSGLPDSMPPGLPAIESLHNPTLAEAVKSFAKRPLTFEPGSKWSYSNAGMAALGRIVEVVSDRPYDEFLRERLFAPLGMVDTTFYPTREQMRRVAVTYNGKDGKLVADASSGVAPTRDKRYPSPAGGLYSTAPDLAKLYRMLLHRGTIGGRRYISEAGLAEMTRLQTGEIKTGFTEGMGYGLGFGVVRTPTGVTEALSPGTFGHGGAWGTQAWIDPKRGEFAVLLIQRAGLGNSDASEVRREFQRAAFAGGK
jgi:CubicO group peptidase (beta-lactamase class C family)